MTQLLKHRGRAKDRYAPKYGVLYFDHLRSELQALATKVIENDQRLFEELIIKRQDGTLTWNDIYTFQLLLVKYLDFQTLKSKVVSLRIKYQSLIASPSYEAYTATRAADLTEVESPEAIQKLVADYKYLLDEFYMGYAYVSAREQLRTKLLRYGAAFTLGACLVSILLIAASVGVFNLTTDKKLLIGTTLSTILVIVFSGITGAFLSIQQRLQSINNGGDPIYNLSLLTHGWFSIFLSPLSGAVFAVILYLFFAGKLLTGTIFPEIVTDNAPQDLVIKAQVSSQSQGAEQPDASVLPPTSEQKDLSKDSVEIVKSRVVSLADFLPETGPRTGKDFALLIVWSFIAGFAERLVPDTLMRLVRKSSTNT